MKILLKRITGFIIVLHIVPCAFILFSTLEQHEMIQHGYLAPYLLGWVMNIGVIIIWCIVKFIAWCFDYEI